MFAGNENAAWIAFKHAADDLHTQRAIIKRDGWKALVPIHEIRHQQKRTKKQQQRVVYYKELLGITGEANPDLTSKSAIRNGAAHFVKFLITLHCKSICQ